MSSQLNYNWMADITAGCNNESPAISEILYEFLKPISLTESLNLVFKGGYLRKWKRSVPLTSVNPKVNANDPNSDVLNQNKIYSSQSKGRSHERFFWVSQVADSLFLRWYSKRKRSSESIMPLSTVKTIHRGDELTYFDKNDPFDGVPLRQIFVINGKVSLQLSTQSQKETLMWISGLYFASRYARTQYSMSWITNSMLFNTYFYSEKKSRDPYYKFGSKPFKKLINGKEYSLDVLGKYDAIKEPEESFEPPINLAELVYFMQENSILARPEHVTKVGSLVRRILDYRNKINSSFIKMTSTIDLNMNPNHMVKACLEHLNSLNTEYTLFKDDIIIIYPLLKEEEAQELFYNIVRQCALRVILSAGGGKDVEFASKIQPQEYEQFLRRVQGADANEIVANFLAINQSGTPLTYIREEEKTPGPVSCFRKTTTPRIPIKFLTLMGFHWSLSKKFNDICIPQDSDEITNILTLSLKDFWISSSHNTYLVGEQLGGSAAASALSEALIRGCRCIELDCQDGDEEPVLCHAWKNYHLTGSVTLREGLIAIKHAAFQNSRMPVILSFEMHCSDPYKLLAANMVREILGNQLFVLDETDPVDLVTTVELGTLLDKFIVKSKYKSMESSFYGPGETAWQSLIGLRGYNIAEVDINNLDVLQSNAVYAVSETRFLKLIKTSKIIKKLTSNCLVRVYPSATRLASTNFSPIKPWNLGVQFAALNFQSYDRSMLLNHGRFYNSLGYVPKLIYNNVVESRSEIDPKNGFNREQNINNDLNLRVHVLSGTQLPTPFGLQEKNYANSFSNILYSIQTGGAQLDMSNLKDKRRSKAKEKKKLQTAINQGLIVDDEEYDSTLYEIIEKSSQIVMEQTEKICPFVEVTVVGKDEKTYNTTPVNFNSFNPVWSDSNPPFDFQIKNPNQAIIIFNVKHFDTMSSETIGQAAFPVNRLRPGIRWVQLLDSKFMEIECCGLLVNVEMNYRD